MEEINKEQAKQLARTIVELENLEEEVNEILEDCDRLLKGGTM